jgi:predicted glycosyltransferase involved in capsule biosynthesis
LTFKTDDEHFCKSILINGGVNFGKSKVIMVVDNDCILDKKTLQMAESFMMRSGFRVFFPYTDINFLNEGHTRQFIRTGKFTQSRKPSTMHMNRYTGGVIMFTRDVFEKVGGFDEEIKGWGKEDDAFLSKCKRSDVKIERNTFKNTMLHLYHPSVSRSDYIKSDRYRLNSEMLAVIKRMSDEDFLRFLIIKKDNHQGVLNQLVEKYRKLGKLDIETKVMCGDGIVTFDTSAYDVKPDKDGNIGLEELLKAAYEDDGVETLQFTIGLINQFCRNLGLREQRIIDKYKKHYDVS